MKKSLFIVALCMIASASFAQKKALRDAERMYKATPPNIGEARTLIKGALENAETKDLAQTWYVAGAIEDAQFTQENNKQVLGQQPNEAVMYDALVKIYPYYIKAYELDQLPNEKGKIKPKYDKSIKNTFSMNHIYYINGGAYYFDNKEYQKAYDFFDQYLKIANHPMFENEKDKTIAERDSNYMMVQFYAGVVATQMGNSELAVENLKKASELPYRQNDVFQFLATEYEQAKDTANLEITLQAGFEKFPEEQYFLMSLINLYIFAGENEKAVQYLNTAIAQEPNKAMLYDVLGKVYETGLKDIKNAEANFLKALELSPEDPSVLSNVGRVYFNQAIETQSEANSANKTEYQSKLDEAKKLFEKALPFFEKVKQLNPSDKDANVALRGIYYNLNMGDKLKEIEKEMGM